MPNGFQNDTKMDARIIDFHVFLKKAKMHETICFTIENVVLAMQKRIKNRSKIDAKSMLEKGMQKVWKMMQKWSQNGCQNRSKKTKMPEKRHAKNHAEI